ncbi:MULTISPECIES: tail fiber protein [Aequorivita]|uniref:Tail fiber protein n=2 Tax=Aequorivita TaxID=153265 RepID=A0AB35YYM5_9FLAO|nr:tail fiber protein [Aequorivita sp. Ant34-E75]WGF91297.1 tail fiber protein [Aequorivita sp. Ant34-E75]
MKILFPKIVIVIVLLFCFSATAQRNPFKNLVEKNGKIGIGTTTPDELLTVKGKIHTQEVMVDLYGAVAPDYVFESYYTGFSEIMPEYNLISLEDLEVFLKENHHLPNIPSAEKMEMEGISLKEMNLLLLQKIEELTLYTLQQQKEIDALKKIVQTLNK